MDDKVHLAKTLRAHTDTLLADGTLLTSWEDQPLRVTLPLPPMRLPRATVPAVAKPEPVNTESPWRTNLSPDPRAP